MTIKNFLKKYNSFDKDINRVDFHMGLFNYELDGLKYFFPELNGKNDKEILSFIKKIYRLCDSGNPEYDKEFDDNMVRFCLKTDKFYGGHSHSVYHSDVLYYGSSENNNRR